MQLEDLLKLSHQILKDIGAPHALIGAFGMSAHGYRRATNDIDFLVDGEYRPQVESEFSVRGFSVFNSNDEVLQLKGPGIVDIIFAKRPLRKQMLGRENLVRLFGVPVLDAEDIIGLKIQALATNPKRKFRELGDIQSLSQVKQQLDWERIKQYADLFGAWPLISEIKDAQKND